MTEIIDANHEKQGLFNKSTPNPLLKLLRFNCHKELGLNSEEFDKQKCCSVFLKRPNSLYDLLLIINPYNMLTTIKIYLIKKCGQILKIRQQQLKIFLIRKFLGLENFYRPRIDPITGEAYFRMDYFQLKTHKQNFSNYQIQLIYKKLNLERLNESIEQFTSLVEHGMQHNSGEGASTSMKQIQNLSKAMCTINDFDFTEYLSSISQQAGNMQQQNQSQDQKNIIDKNFFSDFDHFVSNSKFRSPSCNKSLITKQLKQIEVQGNNLNIMAKRKQGKSNYETLLINHQTQKQLKEVMFKMTDCKNLKSSIKVMESELGKVTLNLEKDEESVYRTKMRLLNSLPRNTEYHFFDKYFKNPQTTPILISLSLKEESLPKFIENNLLTLSMQTKMRILLQIFSGVHTLWEERNIILYINTMKKVHITKNLSIKIRNLTHYYKVDTQMMLEEKSRVNIKLLDNWLNLSHIYFKLFYGYDIGYVRPAANCSIGSMSVEYVKAKVISRSAVGVKLLPEGLNGPTKQILVGLNYIFLSFIAKAREIISQPLKKKQSNIEIFTHNGSLQQEKQMIEENPTLISYKLTCCWLYKNFEFITKEGI